MIILRFLLFVLACGFNLVSSFWTALYLKIIFNTEPQNRKNVKVDGGMIIWCSDFLSLFIAFIILRCIF